MSQSGITEVSRRPDAALAIPPGIAPSVRPRYGMAVPFQLTPNTAGLFCNIRKTQVGAGGDYELGTDVVHFDDLSRITADAAIPVSRNHEEFNPNAGEMSMIWNRTVL